MKLFVESSKLLSKRFLLFLTDLIATWLLLRDYRKSKVVLHSLNDSDVSPASLCFHGSRIALFVNEFLNYLTILSNFTEIRDY